MPLHPTRRQLMQGAGLLAGALFAGSARAASPLLRVQSRQIVVLGRAATVYGITGPGGGHGIIGREGERFAGEILNETDEGLTLHFHGQIRAPFEADRARPGGGALAPGLADSVDFPLTPGTHWMHAHSLSEQLLLAAPMVGREARAPQMAEAVVMLHDFSFTPPAELLEALGGTDAHGAMAMGGAGMDHAAMGHGAGDGGGQGMAAMSAGMTHANDIAYDAFLANDRTLADPEVIGVEPGREIRLRIINGATATGFWIRTGQLAAQVVAVDGNPCLPVTGTDFALAQGQRIDLILSIPREGGAFPVFAQVEDSARRTGVILATPGAPVARQPDEAEAKAGFLDLSLDQALAAAAPLAPAPAAVQHHLILGQDAGYVWTINGQRHGAHTPLTAAPGQRVELMFMNPSMMMHPMHLHGHHFQVVEINGWRFQGPLRDTVIVPPMAMVTVALDAVPGQWLLHCHHLYHMATGMMTELHVA